MTYYTQYRHLALEGAKPAPTAQQIAAIETLLEAPLPPAFLAFLQVANGAWFDYTTDVPDGNGGVEKMGFNTFFSADEGDFCDETWWAKSAPRASIRTCRCASCPSPAMAAIPWSTWT